MAAGIRRWTHLSLEPKIVRRACKTAMIVGTFLIVVNHGDAILRGDLSGGRLAKMLLTLIVPYVVCTVSCVGALLEAEAGVQRGAAS
jgi:hypothetical protein